MPTNSHTAFPTTEFAPSEIANASAGRRACRAITKRHARSFYFASHWLDARTRADAYAIYAFCRAADNAVDEAIDGDDALRCIAQSEATLEQAYGGGPVDSWVCEFRRAVHGREIPKRYFNELLAGMRMDLEIHRYETFEALDEYCYRAAGVVGLMMAHIFGFRDERCLPRAVELGKAMQLTNILRDIGDDFALGRVYLPQKELREFGVDDQQLREGRVDEAFRELMRFQIARARGLYCSAEEGIADLLGRRNRATARLMSRLYAGILEAIERLDYDVFARRAHVELHRKLACLCAAGFARKP